MGDVVIVDIGFGNVRSMQNALERARTERQTVHLSRDVDHIASAERLVIAGVGAFPECRAKLDASGLLPSIQAAVDAGRPQLGISVGMQMMVDEGLEFAPTPGLGWIGGTCRRLELDALPPGVPRKLPHVGWTPLDRVEGPLFEGVPAGAHLYFVHSYVVVPARPELVVATATYGESFTAAVQRDNVFGCQFHPERSAAHGLKILENFCRWPS